MRIDKIQEFNRLHQAYLEKKRKIINSLYILENLSARANACLSSSIDNGFDAKWLVNVANDYAIKKFNGKTVNEFMHKLNEAFFKDIEQDLKDTLEVIDISVIFTSTDYFSSKVASPVIVSLYDSKTKYKFRLSIPAENGDLYTNLNCVEKDNVGLYVLDVAVKFNGIMSFKEICRSFDKDNVAIALRKCLSGEFNEELTTLKYESKTISSSYFYNHIPDKIELILKHRLNHKDDVFSYDTIDNSLFNAEFDGFKFSNRATNCIDDTKDYVPDDVRRLCSTED